MKNTTRLDKSEFKKRNKRKRKLKKRNSEFFDQMWEISRKVVERDKKCRNKKRKINNK